MTYIKYFVLLMVLFSRSVLGDAAFNYYSIVTAPYKTAYGDTEMFDDTSIFVSTNYDLVKLDAAGEAEWNISSSPHLAYMSLQKGINNTFALGATADGVTPTLMKMNQSNILWGYKYSGVASSARGNAFSWMLEDTDNSLYVTGIRNNYNNIQGILTKLNSDGSVLWSKMWQNVNYQNFMGRVSSIQGNLVLTGASYDSVPNRIGVVMCVNKTTGSVIFSYSYGGSNAQVQFIDSIKITTNNLAVVGGFNNDMLAAKIDNAFSSTQFLGWANVYKPQDGTNYTFRAEQMTATNDSIIFGVTAYNPISEDAPQYPWILKVLISNGNLVWAKKLINQVIPISLLLSGYDIIAAFHDGVNTYSQWHIMKLDGNGTLGNCVSSATWENQPSLNTTSVTSFIPKLAYSPSFQTLSLTPATFSTVPSGNLQATTVCQHLPSSSPSNSVAHSTSSCQQMDCAAAVAGIISGVVAVAGALASVGMCAWKHRPKKSLDNNVELNQSQNPSSGNTPQTSTVAGA